MYFKVGKKIIILHKLDASSKLASSCCCYTLKINYLAIRFPYKDPSVFYLFICPTTYLEFVISHSATNLC